MTIVRDLPPSAVCRGASTTNIRAVIPLQLCGLVNVSREIDLEAEATASIATVLDALEIRHPRLRETIRDQLPLQQRPFIWFFAYGEDLSLHPPTSSLPENVVTGKQLLRIVGAIAGG